ncbi:hypothetical protein BS78_02G268900 [Paspalum vaginatum]|nr:hypothetical protein BS78_02G268900 [Paspalum vaginatum]
MCLPSSPTPAPPLAPTPRPHRHPGRWPTARRLTCPPRSPAPAPPPFPSTPRIRRPRPSTPSGAGREMSGRGRIRWLQTRLHRRRPPRRGRRGREREQWRRPNPVVARRGEIEQRRRRFDAAATPLSLALAISLLHIDEWRAGAAWPAMPRSAPRPALVPVVAPPLSPSRGLGMETAAGFLTKKGDVSGLWAVAQSPGREEGELVGPSVIGREKKHFLPFD